jgi:hypothetical protein
MTYQQMCDGLAAANDWLTSLRIREQHDRIRQHMERIALLEEARKAGALMEATQGDDGRLAMFSLTEAVEFLDTFSAFAGDPPGGLRRRLKDALAGPADLAAEATDSNQARNIMFELNLASRIRSRGLPVDLPKENPDILTRFENVSLCIQCKRPYKEETIPANIEKAASQLRRDLDADANPDARGIVAISVSRVFNPGDQIFAGPDEASVAKRLGDEVQQLGESHASTWKKIVDPRIVGILFHLITPAHIQEINLLTVAQEIIVFALLGRPDSDVELLREFSSAMKGEIPNYPCPSSSQNDSINSPKKDSAIRIR